MSSSSTSGIEQYPVKYVHSISEAGRLLPSASKWASIELDFHLVPKSNTACDSLSSQYSKSIEYELVITDKQYFKRFLYISLAIVFLVVAVILLVHFLPQKHKHHRSSKNLTLALNQALMFFDAQKSGNYQSNSPVKFRGNSGLQDGDSIPGRLVGGFYDSGNNIKFSFPTAYTITLLSWTVIEYHEKYADIGELDHVRDIIRWGSDYLLEVFVPPNSTSDPFTLYSQVGSGGNGSEGDNDISCWQRPEDMNYKRPVSSCGAAAASDLAGEIVAALSAASIVFKEDNAYSAQLINSAEILFEVVTKNDTDHKHGTYTSVDDCGGEARRFYNSSGYKDELVWGGTWLFFATGNNFYFRYATDHFSAAKEEEIVPEKGIFYWNNKLTSTAVLLTRLLYFHDMGYQNGLGLASNMTHSLICSYLSHDTSNRTPGGLILLSPNNGKPIQFAATASFLSKLYSDYLQLLLSSGDNPMKMSYMVGYGDKYPTHVHHRAASIPWDGQYYTCEEGERWFKSKDQNPNILYGAMVAGPDQFDNFLDERDKPRFTEPNIASNAGLVAALIALHHPPPNSPNSNSINLGLDKNGIF
ncbi:hypothetical protein JCGZ_25221 [Jatropha curcas]|uniref:cellulase n=1 Tax=Jatropha curcas TaxID=180498 RepID=A0A067LEU1_JATCU|nr:hypothetical protein JCGZ_25221 [Jatropha curcas]